MDFVSVCSWVRVAELFVCGNVLRAVFRDANGVFAPVVKWLLVDGVCGVKWWLY